MDKCRRALHFNNTPVQYITFFYDCKSFNFQIQTCDIFLIFAQNIDRGYNLCFRAKLSKLCTPVNLSFTI